MDITKAHYRSGNNRLSFEITGGSEKDIFEGIAHIQEVFEVDDKCGCCNSPQIIYRVRESADLKKKASYKYYEMVCRSCSARFQFGQSQDMKSLFPKRRDENGNWLPNRGWSKYVPKEEVA
jgi:hypothetical protein